MKKILLLIFSIMALAAGSCIEDGFDTSSSSQPSFSTDTLDLGVQFAGRPSPTYMLTIRNPHPKQLLLSSVSMRDGSSFRINVDGQSGSRFTDVEIRPKDSIYVFVEATFLPTGLLGEQLMADRLDVVTNGVTRSVTVTARCVDGVELKNFTVGADTEFTADRPYLITDTLRISRGASLTLAPGATLLFHDKASMVVEGSLTANGTSEAPVTLRGDRTGSVVADISFDVMSNQWNGVYFAPESTGNRLTHTSIVNTCSGVAVDSLAQLTMLNCRLSNSGGSLLTAADATITALGCELSNAADALALLIGSGSYRFDRCTLANWYLFAYPGLAIMELTDPAMIESLDVTNSIIYGRGAPLGFGEAKADELLEMPLTFRRCLFKVKGEDDGNFISCLWDTDPLLDYSLTDYVFPYTPLEDSPALEAADPEFNHPLLPSVDINGRPRALTLGAYEPNSQ